MKLSMKMIKINTNEMSPKTALGCDTDEKDRNKNKRKLEI